VSTVRLRARSPVVSSSRSTRAANAGDIEVTLEITPRVPHVFQAYHPILDEAPAALDKAGQFLSAHLDGAERVTA
jgi:monoterpene epsilon-lactone hydrolase